MYCITTIVHIHVHLYHHRCPMQGDIFALHAHYTVLLIIDKVLMRIGRDRHDNCIDYCALEGVLKVTFEVGSPCEIQVRAKCERGSVYLPGDWMRVQWLRRPPVLLVCLFCSS